MVATLSPWTARRDLLWAPRKLAVVQWSYDVPLIETVKDPATGDLALPGDGTVLGLHAKQSGGRLSQARTINDIRSHGVAGPTRRIPTQQNITLGLDAQETHRQNLQNYWGADLSDTLPDAAGGVHFDVPELPLNLLSRVVLLGKDDWNGLPIYIAWIGNRIDIGDTNEQNLTDPEVALYPYVMNFQGEDELEGSPVAVEIFGTGWKALQDRGVDTGFGGGS